MWQVTSRSSRTSSRRGLYSALTLTLTLNRLLDYSNALVGGLSNLHVLHFRAYRTPLLNESVCACRVNCNGCCESCVKGTAFIRTFVVLCEEFCKTLNTVPTDVPMYGSWCTEMVHILTSQCTEVVHPYVPTWSFTGTEVVLYQSTEAVRPIRTEMVMYRSGPTPAQLVSVLLSSNDYVSSAPLVNVVIAM